MRCIHTGIRGSRMWLFRITLCTRRSTNSVQAGKKFCSDGTITKFALPEQFFFTFAKVAHLVERDLAKVEVAGSSPVFRS